MTPKQKLERIQKSRRALDQAYNALVTLAPQYAHERRKLADVIVFFDEEHKFVLSDYNKWKKTQNASTV